MPFIEVRRMVQDGPIFDALALGQWGIIYRE
jgi:hypothetical protein